MVAHHKPTKESLIRFAMDDLTSFHPLTRERIATALLSVIEPADLDRKRMLQKQVYEFFSVKHPEP